MTIPLNSDWIRRRNGSSNRKNPMSRPNTGSTTGVAGSGENGTRLAHSRIVDHDAATDAPMIRATRTARTARTTPAMGVRSGMSSGPNVTVRRTAVVPAAAAPPRVGGVVQAFEQVPERAAAVAGALREPGRDREVDEDDRERADRGDEEQRQLGREPRPEDRVEPDALEPQRVRPQVEPEAEGEDQRRG